MFPLFNSLAFHSNANPSSAPQVMANPGNFAPSPMQHPQMGMPNPQTAIPFTNSNALFVPNQFFPMQAPQNFNNPNPMNQMNNMNAPNPVARFYNQNSVNPSQFMNHNLNLGLGFPNQIQNMNQIFPMQLPNLNGQAVAGNFNLPQNLAFVASNQLGFGNVTGAMQHQMNLNSMNQIPDGSQKLQAVQAFAPFPPQQNTNNFQLPPPISQGNNRNNDKMNKSGRNPRNKNFLRNPKHAVSRDRFTKSQVRNFQNTKGNFRSHPMQSRKGNGNDDGKKTFVANSAKQARFVPKRSISLNYTEQEIQQWRKERRKNYPSKANIEKKLAEKLKEPGTADLDAKLRRQQLKDILAKQAELGCEVAEIPACYLSDSEKQEHGRRDNGRALNKKEKFQNKFNKSGRFNQDDRFSKKRSSVNRDTSGTYSQTDRLAKKQRVQNDNSVINHGPRKREPTLLQKLLSADVKRDKQHLLQVFRFMVMNSFFKDWPEQPLKFPLVVVKETGTEGKSKDISEESPYSDHGDNNNMENADAEVQARKSSKLEGGFRGEESLEEEGEIID